MSKISPSIGHFSKDTPDTPDIHRRRVLARSHENIGSPVPQRYDFVCVGPNRNTKGPGQTKVGQFELALPVNEQIRWLQIAVQDPVVMTIGHAGEELVKKGFENGQIEARVANVQVLFQVLVEKLKDQC